MFDCGILGCNNLAEIEREEKGDLYQICASCALDIPHQATTKDSPLGEPRHLEIGVTVPEALEILRHLNKAVFHSGLNSARNQALKNLQAQLLEGIWK